MSEQRDGWFVRNVREGRWYGNAAFGKICTFETVGEKFPQVGIHLYVLEPGKPNCRYHREDAQEDFLVLSGECLLLIEGEERRLTAWDFVHCSANVNHVFVGAGDGPCALLAIGHRDPDTEIFYPESELARSHGAEAPEPTPDPKVAYSDVPQWQETEPPAWPLGSA